MQWKKNGSSEGHRKILYVWKASVSFLAAYCMFLRIVWFSKIIFKHRLTGTGLRGQRENERRGWFSSGDGAPQRLRLERTQLLHEVRALHQSHVSEVQVAEYLVLEATRTFLVGARQVEAAGIATEAFLVVVVVVVQRWWLCNKIKYKYK